MKEEKQGTNVPKKEIETQDKKVNKKRIDYLVTYEVEGARSKRQKTSAYSEEEAEAIVTKKLNEQIARGEINGFKIVSVDVENHK